MAIVKNNGCEGTDGVTVLVANSAVPDAWTSIGTGATTTLKYSTANKKSGNSCIEIVAASAESYFTQWTYDPSPSFAISGYLRLTSQPTVNETFCQIRNSSNVVMANANVTSGRFFSVSDTTGSNATTGIVQIPLSTWVKWQFRATAGADTVTGAWEFAWFDASDVLQEQAVFTATTKNTTILNANTFRLFRCGAPAEAITYQMDGISATSFATGLIAPYTPPANVAIVSWDDERAYYTSKGYTGSFMDQRRQFYLATLALPNTDPRSNQDLRYLWLSGQGYSGTIDEMNFAWRTAGSLVPA